MTTSTDTSSDPTVKAAMKVRDDAEQSLKDAKEKNDSAAIESASKALDAAEKQLNAARDAVNDAKLKAYKKKNHLK